MTSSHPHASVPGMDKSYNENSQIQKQAFEHFWPWLEDAVTHSSNLVPFRQSNLISYVDFGCSGGRNSARHFLKFKTVLESAGFLGGDASSQLQVTLVDVPSNDWNKVADTFFKPGAVGCAENILPCLVPKSFYAGEVAPAGSLHIGISVDALQWLSHAPPLSLKDSITYVDGGPTHVEAFRRQFEGDAEHFLRLRAMEFGPGGLLLLILPGTLGGRHICEGLLSCVSDAASELSVQGKIDASLLEDFIWPIYVPTEDELESIVNKAGSWEVLQRGGVSLTQMWDAYRESEDADAYAKVMTSAIFSAGGLLLRSRLAISEDTLQELRDKAEELVRKDPNKYVFRNIHVAVLLRRTRRRQSVDTGGRWGNL